MDALPILIFAFETLCRLHGKKMQSGVLWENEEEAAAWLIKIAKGPRLWYHVNGLGFAEPILKRG